MNNIITKSTYTRYNIPDKNNDIEFDLFNISKSEIKNQYYNFIIFKKDANLMSLLFENNKGKYIHENKNITVPLDIVKKDISDIFGLHDWQFQVQICCNNIACAFYIPNIGDNINLLIKSMEQLGWIKSRVVSENLYGYNYVNIKFEPLYSVDITEEVHNIGILYHVSPLYNHKSIKKNGFIPQHKNNKFEYPDRIYFITGNVDIDYVYQVANMLNDLTKTFKYIIYTIDVNKIPKFVKFQIDPNLENSVYTTYKIPYKFVINSEILNLNDFI